MEYLTIVRQLAEVLSRVTEVSIDSGDAKATITIVDYSELALDTVTVTIDTTAHVLTEGTDWNRGASNTAAATSLAAAIDALDGVSASASAAVVTITAPENITSLAVSDAVNMTLVDSSLTTIFDPSKNWEGNKWTDAIVEVEVDDIHYYRTIASNTADTLTIATLPDGHPVAAGAHYNIRMALRLADIDKWGGTTLTGRDISLDLAKIIPIAKAAIFNTALPVAEANWLVEADIEPTNSPSYLRIYACVSVTGILRVARTQDATTVTEDLNSGTALVADAAYMFTVPWRTGDSINIKYSVTDGTIKRLLIDEIGAAE